MKSIILRPKPILGTASNAIEQDGNLHLLTVTEPTVARLMPQGNGIFSQNRFQTNRIRSAAEEKLLLGGYIGIDRTRQERW